MTTRVGLCGPSAAYGTFTAKEESAGGAGQLILLGVGQ
jgi:hypothetical protein